MEKAISYLWNQLPQHLGKMTSFSFVKKLPEEFKPILLTKKSPMLSHATVK